MPEAANVVHIARPPGELFGLLGRHDRPRSRAGVLDSPLESGTV